MRGAIQARVNMLSREMWRKERDISTNLNLYLEIPRNATILPTSWAITGDTLLSPRCYGSRSSRLLEKV